MGWAASFVSPAAFTRRNSCRCILTRKYVIPWVGSGRFELTHKNLLPLQEFHSLIFRRRGCSIANLVLCFGYEAGEFSLHCHQKALVRVSHTLMFKGVLSPNGRLNSSLLCFLRKKCEVLEVVGWSRLSVFIDMYPLFRIFQHAHLRNPGFMPLVCATDS
jgi:hypothetical protein